MPSSLGFDGSQVVGIILFAALFVALLLYFPKFFSADIEIFREGALGAEEGKAKRN